jgi:type II secretory pathway pseudopilin PulG
VRREDSDAGFTLLDTVMSTVVMTIVMAVFTSSVLVMYRTANNIDAKSLAQTQIAQALLRIDRQLRYAKGISKEYGGGTYVDFLTVRKDQQQCVQLRVSGNVLAQRTWTYQKTPIDLTAWTPLASNVTSTGSQPFTYLAPSQTQGFQQLKVSLFIGSGSGREASTVTFTALNSGRTSANDYCSAARSL